MDLKDADFQILNNYDINNKKQINKHLDLLVHLKTQKQLNEVNLSGVFLEQVDRFKVAENLPDLVGNDPVK